MSKDGIDGKGRCIIQVEKGEPHRNGDVSTRVRV